MALYIFLDKAPQKDEPLSGHLVSLDTDNVSWIEDLGFGWVGKIDENLSYFADGSKVKPYPRDEFKKEWLNQLLDHLTALKELKESKDYKERILKLNRDLAQIEAQKEEILSPAREYSSKYLSKDSFKGLDRAEKHETEAQRRQELQRLYQELKSSPDFLKAQENLSRLISDNRDLFESEAYPSTREEAIRKMEGSGIVVEHDRTIPDTIYQKIASVESALKDFDDIVDQKKILTDMISSALRCHGKVGIAASVSLSPLPIGRLDSASFLSGMRFPLPSRRILVLK